MEGKKTLKNWSMRGSNSRPSRYQHDALPTEPMDHTDYKRERFGLKLEER